jgi:hypothetical protein
MCVNQGGISKMGVTHAKPPCIAARGTLNKRGVHRLTSRLPRGSGKTFQDDIPEANKIAAATAPVVNSPRAKGAFHVAGTAGAIRLQHPATAILHHWFHKCQREEPCDINQFVLMLEGLPILLHTTRLCGAVVDDCPLGWMSTVIFGEPQDSQTGFCVFISVGVSTGVLENCIDSTVC